MPLRGSLPRFGLIGKRDTARLVVIFQDIRIAFHRIDGPKLHMRTFKLDGDTHFRAGEAPSDIASTTLDPPNGRRRANRGKKRFGLGGQSKMLAPGVKCFRCHFHERLPWLCWKSVNSCSLMSKYT